jgi:uncharacterized protein YegL
MTAEFDARINEDNPDPRVACVLLLDTSSSMGVIPITESIAPITQLNAGFDLFCREIKDDPLAKKRTEVCVITFGGIARVEIPFTEGRDLQPREFSATGGTPLGAALNLALEELKARKDAYKSSGLEYFRPWLFVITDGAPTDTGIFDLAAARVREVEAAKGVAVFGVAVGAGVDMAKLATISAERQPLSLSGYSFAEMFKWLSASMGVVSSSANYGSSDSGITQAESTEQTPLPTPTGWATW